jgi:hypothetical protein
VKPSIPFAVLVISLAMTPLDAFAGSPVSAPQPLAPEAPFAALLPLSALVVVVHAGVLLAIRHNSRSAVRTVDGD